MLRYAHTQTHTKYFFSYKLFSGKMVERKFVFQLRNRHDLSAIVLATRRRLALTLKEVRHIGCGTPEEMGSKEAGFS